MSGWIKIHRDILYHEIWSDKPFSKGQAWIDLILLANHSDNKCMVGNKVEEIKRGSFITSELKLMDRWGWGRKKVQLFLKFLESESMIVRSTNNKRTAITIVNYEVYQYQGALKEQQKSNKRASKVHEQEKKKNKNEKNFNNFERRKYNMDSLEGELLEVDQNGTTDKA